MKTAIEQMCEALNAPVRITMGIGNGVAQVESDDVGFICDDRFGLVALKATVRGNSVVIPWEQITTIESVPRVQD
jgi:hypothetical protein